MNAMLIDAKSEFKQSLLRYP